MEDALTIDDIQFSFRKKENHPHKRDKRNVHAIKDKKDLKDRKCFNCQKLGHMAKDC